MNKKLFIVLAVIAAMLVTFSLVMGAKESRVTNDAERYVKPTPPTKVLAQSPSARQKGAVSPIPLSGTPIRLGTPGGKDLCNLAGTAAWFITDYIWGVEWYANYQDPAAHGCTSVWPFEVTEIDFRMNFPATWVTAPVSLQGFVFADVGTPTCPRPENTPGFICSTPIYTYTIPAGGGYFILPMPLTEECCVYDPYFAVVYISTDLSGLGVDAVSEGVAATCRSYNDYGSGWAALNSWPGPIMLYSQGYTEPQNDCPPPPVGCCQLAGSCATMTENDCETALGVWAGPGATCVGNYCQETGVGCCQISDVCVSMGEAACEFVGGSYSPPPAACIGNLCVMTGAGCCQLTGACAEMEPGPCAAAGGVWHTATWQCVGTTCEMPPAPPCNLQNDVGTYWLVYGNLVGDGYATYFDPDVCGTPPTYPFGIDTVRFELDDVAEPGYPVTWPLDVRVTVYGFISDICVGPVVPVHSEVFTIQQAEANALINRTFSQTVCVYGPFYVGLFLESGTDFQPTFSETFANYADSCKAWAYWGGVWYNWSEATGPWGWIGFPVIRAHGFTDHADCPPVLPPMCDILQYTHGPLAGFMNRPSSTYGRNYLNERMTASISGKVGKVGLSFYSRTTTPNLRVYIWDDDGTGLPGNKIDSLDIAHPVPLDPIWAEVDFTPLNISFAEGQEFHVGYTCTNFSGATNRLGLEVDGGGCGSDRLSEYFASLPGHPPGFYRIKEIYAAPNDIDAFVRCELCVDQPNFVPTVDPCYQEITWLETTSYTVNVKSLGGFNLPVTLSLAGFPPSAGTATFVPNPVTPSKGTAQLNIDPVDGPLAAGEYLLTITGTVGVYTHQTTTWLKINSPFNEEALVDFYHGQQRVTNFGAVGNDAEDPNFICSGVSALFDGSFIVATTGPEHLAMDVYDCHYLNWLASGPIDTSFNAKYNANVAYANFFTTEDAISCEYDSLFIVGIMDSCTDFSIKIKVYYNPTLTPIYGMYMSLFEDWDVPASGTNWAEINPANNLYWQYDPSNPNQVFGAMKAPFYDDPLYGIATVKNPQYVYPNAGFCKGWGLDSLYWLIHRPGFFGPETYSVVETTDYSMLMTAGPIDLLAGQKHMEVWIDFKRNLADGLSWNQWWHRVLRYVGFYRGDVNASDSTEMPQLDVTDVVYLTNYLFQYGPAPIPYEDQGDVNADGIVNVLDVVYMYNFTFTGGPSLKDYVRFIPQMWIRPTGSLFLNPNWR